MNRIRDNADRPNPAVVLHPSGIQVTFAKLEAPANQLAYHLRADGLVAGDTIAILVENDRYVHAVMWAARRSGLHHTLVNTNLAAHPTTPIPDECDGQLLQYSAGVGFVADDGYVYLTDRKHHMIISGGVNVYPQEAEHVLVTHPLVVDVAMFGVPDEELGQRAMAVVEPVDPTSASADLAAELLAWVRDRLATYKCPRTIVFEDRLPRTDAGKLAKRPLVEKYSVTRTE